MSALVFVVLRGSAGIIARHATSRSFLKVWLLFVATAAVAALVRHLAMMLWYEQLIDPTLAVVQLLLTVAAGVLSFLAPQIPGIAAGFTIIWALAWRRQDAAVEAIEERDGATFYVERTAPHQPIKLVRTPGFRREVITQPG